MLQGGEGCRWGEQIGEVSDTKVCGFFVIGKIRPMSNKFTFLSALALLLVFTSCHKNNDTPGADSGPLEGNYRFLYIIGDTKITATGSSFGVTGQQISTCQFKTSKDTGTVILTADSLMGKNLGYSVNAPVTTVRYANGIVIDTTIEPFVLTVPSGNWAT